MSPPARKARVPKTAPSRLSGSRKVGESRSSGGRQVGASRSSSVSKEAGLGGEQVEGRRAVLELLAAGRRRVRDLWISDSVEESEVMAEILELAAAARVPVRRLGRTRLDAEARTEAPQGVIAHAVGLEATPLEHLARLQVGGGPAFLVVIDQVTDPHNLGALLRSAEAAGATGVVLGRHRSAHVTPTVTKAAAGAVEYLPMALVSGIPTALADLAKIGIWSVGLDPNSTSSVFDLGVADGPIALVLGAEGHGLSRLARQRCDVLASIPQMGRIGSLNVSAAGAVAMFEIARRRGLASGAN